MYTQGRDPGDVEAQNESRVGQTRARRVPRGKAYTTRPSALATMALHISAQIHNLQNLLHVRARWHVAFMPQKYVRRQGQLVTCVFCIAISSDTLAAGASRKRLVIRVWVNLKTHAYTPTCAIGGTLKSLSTIRFVCTHTGVAA